MTLHGSFRPTAGKAKSSNTNKKAKQPSKQAANKNNKQEERSRRHCSKDHTSTVLALY